MRLINIQKLLFSTTKGLGGNAYAWGEQLVSLGVDVKST